MAKTKQSNLIASVKMLNIGIINKDTINLGKDIQYLLITIGGQVNAKRYLC